MSRSNRPIRRILSVVVALLIAACTPDEGFDPVSADPSRFDATDPPRLVETSFEVEGVTLHAIVYEAQGRGPHPTAVLLHGFPGNEKNLDLAQAIRRAGWNVVFFHYRGSWGSGGVFSFGNVLADVAGVVQAIAVPAFAATHRIDPERLALVGHSMGGFAALVSGAEIERVDCVVSMAGANLGGLVASFASSPEAREAAATSLESWSGPIRGQGGAALVAEAEASRDRFDTLRRASALARKPLLLIAGGLDRVTPRTLHHDPLVDALEAESAVALQATVYPQADHSFSGQRIALARRITGWLGTACVADD